MEGKIKAVEIQFLMLCLCLLCYVFPFVLKLNAGDHVNNPMRVRAYKILRGHKSSVQCVAVQTAGEMFRIAFLFLTSPFFFSLIYEQSNSSV